MPESDPFTWGVTVQSVGKHGNTAASARAHTHSLCTANICTYIFPDPFVECQSRSLKPLVSLLQATVLILDKHLQNISAVTLPNWEIILSQQQTS